MKLYNFIKNKQIVVKTKLPIKSFCFNLKLTYPLIHRTNSINRLYI
jgi:hypothetical protein